METSVNNKCRAFTSLEQSKKLSKILPIESSDMYWDLLSKSNYAKVNDIGYCLCRTCVYAWSLAALLDILKDKITFGGASDKDWFVAYTAKTPRKLLTIYKSNLVDACVAMIIKLNELKML